MWKCENVEMWKMWKMGNTLNFSSSHSLSLSVSALSSHFALLYALAVAHRSICPMCSMW